jgi:hypothetical protein
MLRSTLARIYRRLPLVRELLALAAEERGTQATLRQVEQNLIAAQAICAFDAERRGNPRYQEPRRLLAHQAQVCSQNGEDGVIQEIFRRIGTTNRVFAEVGVGDGQQNNTAFLLSQGWTGFWIDGSSSFQAALAKRDDLQGDCLRSLVAYVSQENIASLFGQLGVPQEFDLLSLDIDQNTYFAWAGLRRFRPRVLVIEYNSAIPPGVDWKVRYGADRVWDGSQNFGASLKALELLGRELGYSLVGCEWLGANAFFVRDDLLADRFAEPFTAENHHEPPRYALCHRRVFPQAILDRNSTGGRAIR